MEEPNAFFFTQGVSNKPIRTKKISCGFRWEIKNGVSNTVLTPTWKV